MKKLVSCFLALAVLVSVISTVPLVADAEDELSIRIVQDFEDASRAEANLTYNWEYGATTTYENSGINGSKADKIAATGSGAWSQYRMFGYPNSTMTSAELPWRTDWSEVQYVQFYVENLGEATAHITYGLSDNNGRTAAYEYLRITDSSVEIQTMPLSTGIWESATATTNGDNFYGYTVPVGFKGLVRIEFDTSKMACTWNNVTITDTVGALMFYAYMNATTLIVDDVALVGNFTDVAGTQYTESSYLLNIAPQPDVRIVQDFSDASRTEANLEYNWHHNTTNSYEAGGSNNSKANKIVASAAGAWWQYRMFGYSNSTMTSAELPWRTDWSEVQFVQFYVENLGEETAHITYGLSDNNGRNAGNEYLRITDSSVKIQTMPLSTGIWESATATTNDDNVYGYTVPAGFKGLVRIEFAPEKMACVWNNVTITDTVGALMLYAYMNPTTLIVDDIALVGDFTDEIEGYQFTTAEYIKLAKGESGSSSVGLDMESVSDIRVFQDFEAATITAANAGMSWEYAQSNTMVAGGKDNSTAMRMFNDNNGWAQYSLFGYTGEAIASAWRTNWTGAKYIQFYADNQGAGTADIVFGLADSSGRLGQEIFYHNSADLKIYAMDLESGNWEKWQPSLNVDNHYGVTVPAGFKGYIRVQIDPALMASEWNNYTLSLGQIGLCRMFANVKNTTLFVDDFALAGNFAASIKDVQVSEGNYFGQRVEVDMPADKENIRTVLDFENGVSDIGFGINQIPLTLSQSADWSATGSNSLKLVGTGVQPGADHVTQIQPQKFIVDASAASYLEFAVNNPSDIPFGITGINFNGNNSMSYLTDEISIYENGKWYAVEAYDDESFRIPAFYEGKIRIKINFGVISSFEFAVKEVTATADAALYLDTFCMIGDPVVYEEVTMPTDLDLIKTVLDFEKINLVSLKSGINFLPITFSLGTDVADSGNALVITTGTGGGTPNLSQVQPAKFFQNWTGGQYMEMWISNPNDFDFALCWGYIDGVAYNNSNTEISLQFADGKWYKAQTGGDANGAVIPAGFTGKVRVKLDNKFGDLVMVDNMEFAVWCTADIPGQKLYIDSIVVLGDEDQHDEPEVLNAVKEFPVEDILEKIADGQKDIHYQVTENIPVPTEILEAIKGKDIVFSYTVLNKYGVGLYRWTLVGTELTDVTEFYPVVTFENASLVDGAMVKPFTVTNGDVTGAYLSLYVRNDFPSFTAMFVYDADSETLLSYGDIVNELGWFAVSLAEDGEYLLSDMLIEEYGNEIYPTEEPSDPSEDEDPTDPSEGNDPTDPGDDTVPDTGDTHLSVIFAAMIVSMTAAGVMVRKRKER